MNITSDYPVMVFKNENGRYSIGLSDKKQEGNYVNWYKPCSFKKEVELENRTNIYIKKAWLKCNEVNGKKYEYVFISEFKLVEDVIEEAKEQPTIEQPTIEQPTNDPFKNYSNTSLDLELPF